MSFISCICKTVRDWFLVARSNLQQDRENCSSNMKVSGAKALPMLLLMVVMAGLVEQGEGSTCSSTFFSALVQLIPCRPAIAPFSPIPPSEACCNAVVILGQPCLCVLVNGPPITGVDRNMFMQLPEKCVANFEPCGMRKQHIEPRI
ncbi:putative lipid-transfer protein DIR1 [Cornus florida]|uniref:putative lipid-transfer protein DIR1 n=1 Tax=Cornus florida TaxID=4283 RepID=UPI00289D1D9F|nr:putative lipid-transfer protein DIR1 [Cornus florida]